MVKINQFIVLQPVKPQCWGGVCPFLVDLLHSVMSFSSRGDSQAPGSCWNLPALGDSLAAPGKVGLGQKTANQAKLLLVLLQICQINLIFISLLRGWPLEYEILGAALTLPSFALEQGLKKALNVHPLGLKYSSFGVKNVHPWGYKSFSIGLSIFIHWG